MNKWRMEGGRFKYGEPGYVLAMDLGIDQVWDMVVDCQDAPVVQARRMGISCEHFVQLAVLACGKLAVPNRKRAYWIEISNVQKERC